MRNLILIFALFVGLFSNAQESIEVTPFTANGVDYIHVKGGTVTDTACFDNVAVTGMDIYILDGDDIRKLTATDSYRIADEAIRADFRSFLDANEVRLASDNSLYTGPDLLVCNTVEDAWARRDGGDWYSNPTYPGYFYQPFAGTAFFAFVPNGGNCEGNGACQQYSATNPAALSLESFLATPDFADRDAIEDYFENTLIPRHRAGN